MTNLDFFDDRGRVLHSLNREQTENLERVSSRISAAILSFCRARVGKTFHADELRSAVEEVVGKTAPGSADRVLRDLRCRGEVGYEVVNRRQSLYRVREV